MKGLDKLDDNLNKQEIIAKKRAEYTLLGKGKRPHKGMRLWAKTPEGNIFEVKIIPKDYLKISLNGSTSKGAESKAHLNPKNEHVWAVNMKNAKRKLNIHL
jgi:hypothetical protein